VVDQAYAVQINAYGAPTVLEYKPVTLAPLGPMDLRLKAIAAAVNHTDLEIRQGNWPVRRPDPFPYVPGVEAVGEVVEIGAGVSGWRVGDRAITMMQGMGGVRAERPGGYATHVTAPATTVAKLPGDSDPYAIAALGLAGVTAFEGLRVTGSLAGRRVLVTGAAGGVGSAAVQIAKVQGATVVGLVSSARQVEAATAAGADLVVQSGDSGFDGSEVGAVDTILDTVGAKIFSSCLAALKPGGVFSLVGAVSGSDVKLDLWELIRPVTLTGYSTENLTGADLQRVVDALAGWVSSGQLTMLPWTQIPLSEAATAHRALEQRELRGRVLLTP
jgi:NADPH2:quinone reductase